MKTSTERKDGAAVIHVSGEVDMSTSPDLRKVLQTEVKAKTAKIIVDLDGVSYIDSSGLATLVECLQGVRKYNGELFLAGLKQTVKDVFEIARLDEVFELRDDIDAALAS